MRFIALLLLPLTIAAYRGLKNEPPVLPSQATVLPATPSTNIVYQSADGGRTWQDLSQGLPQNLLVKHAFSQGGELFLGTETGLYRSRHPGTGTWEKEDFTQSYRGELVETYINEWVNGIYPGRKGSYVSVADVGFFRILPGQNHWQAMHKELPGNAVYCVLENPDGTLFVGNRSGIYRSADDGKTWAHIFSDGAVTSLVGNDQKVLVASGSQGLMRSADGGNTWTCVLGDQGATYNTGRIADHFTAIRVAGRWQSADETVQLLRSKDGKSWEPLDGGLPAVKHFY
ncbi:MAG: YCF48-related protein, partial [Pseudoxanthomonas sp.]